MRHLASIKRLLIATGLLTLLAATTAYAQTIRMRADIPFQFHAGDKAFSAGRYLVEVDPALHRFVVRSMEGREVLLLAAHTVLRPSGQEQTMLVFRRYGDAYFLRQAWTGGSSSGYELCRTRAEREMAKAIPEAQVASVRLWAK